MGLFTEVRRQKPSVILIPNADTWHATLDGAPLTAFLNMLRAIPPTDPVLVLSTAEAEPKNLSTDLVRDLFGFSRRNRMEIVRPLKVNLFAAHHRMRIHTDRG